MCWWQMRILAKTTQQKKKQILFKGGFPGGTVIKNLLPKAGEQETGFDPWVGKIPWRRKWQSTPVFLPGESRGQSSLEGYSPQGCKESDMTQHMHAHTYTQSEEPRLLSKARRIPTNKASRIMK